MTELSHLVSGIANFGTWSPSQKIRRFAWYLHTHEQRERFDQAAIRTACHALHVEPPGDVGVVFAQMMRKRPTTILRDGRGYRREGRMRAALTSKYGKPESVVAVDRMLADLLGQISDAGERVFVAEAITCYRHHACRAAIAMTWNVPFDHLVTWIFADAARLAAFNASIPVRLGVKRWAGFVVYTRDDLEELTESKVIQIGGHARLVSGNVIKILEDKLRRQHLAAHPSPVAITRARADDVITDLTGNVIAKLG